MIEVQSLQIDTLWPLCLATAVAALLAGSWYLRRTSIFPDVSLLSRTPRTFVVMDRLLIVSGGVLMAVFIFVMMGPSLLVVERIEQRARDFVILVDTSRSMRHDTQSRRDAYELNFPRRAGAFSEATSDPNALPHIGRFELARESLFRFLTSRRSGDRVAMIYFNDAAHPVTALTANIDFVIEQLGSMDDYVNWGTDIAAAMDSGLSMLARYPDTQKRTLILMTDAETRYTQDLEQQLTRLADAGLSFYLLWITTDAENLSTEDADHFLQLAGSIGSVITIKDPDPANMRDALLDISRLEGYRYEETRHRNVNLAAWLLPASRMALLLWLLLAATVFHPLINRRAFEDPAR